MPFDEGEMTAFANLAILFGQRFQIITNLEALLKNLVRYCVAAREKSMICSYAVATNVLIDGVG